MKFMNWMIDNWYIFVAAIAAVIVALRVLHLFVALPTEKQQEKVKEWLIWACIEAEKKLSSGTGQLKLRQVYDMFCGVPAFTRIAKIISFELFSEWVSEALVTVKGMLVSNEALAKYVYGYNLEQEIEKLKKQLEATP